MQALLVLTLYFQISARLLFDLLLVAPIQVVNEAGSDDPHQQQQSGKRGHSLMRPGEPVRVFQFPLLTGLLSFSLRPLCLLTERKKFVHVLERRMI